METTNETLKAAILTPEQLKAHWLGHRNLTRRVIEAFPEKELFEYSIGGMRTFAQMVQELLRIGAPGIEGILTEDWDAVTQKFNTLEIPATKTALLAQWDEASARIDELLPQVPETRFQQNNKVFNQWDGPTYGSIFYFIDNEIHHRAQGYVYLRSLGIEPPAFWER